MADEIEETIPEQKNNSIYLPEIEQKYEFNEGFKYCCRTLKKRVRQDYDATIAITGSEGVSKSTCANQIGFAVDKNYTLEKNCLFSPKPTSVVNAIRQLPRFSAVNADEAVKILYKQEWWLQVFINKFYRLCRQDNKISILTMPRFSEFNEGFRNHRIILWIFLLDRGIGVIYQTDWSPFVKDPWHFDDNQKIISMYAKRRKFHQFTLENKIKIFQRSPNFLDTITFPDLNPELRIQYKQLAALHKYEGLEDEYEEGRKYRAMKKTYADRLSKMIEAMKKKTGFSQKQIAKMLNVPESRISEAIHLEDITAY